MDEKLEQNIIQISCPGIDKAIHLQNYSYNFAAKHRKPYINISTIENYIYSSKTTNNGTCQCISSRKIP
jgi:hypothetical protein